jgi:hypothetical protein
MLVGTVDDYKSLLYEAAYFKWKVTASLPLERVSVEGVISHSEKIQRLRIKFSNSVRSVRPH